jgi:hypothetical protein
MRYSLGKNIFSDNIFDEFEWSAPHLYTVEEVYNAFNQLDIRGRKIAAMQTIGGDFNIFYDILDYPDKFTGSEPIECSVKLDEPIIITLDNGDNIEFYFSSAGDFLISKNCFPPGLKHSVIPNDFDASILFSMCLDKEIYGVNVCTTQFEPMLFDKFPDQSQTIFIDKIDILLNNPFNIRVSADYDYTDIEIRDRDDNLVEITLKEYTKCLNMDVYKEQLELQKERDRRENKWPIEEVKRYLRGF